MSIAAAWIRWDARCRNMPSHGVTAGDTYYLGLRDYVEPYPCPNGLPIDYSKPADSPAWNARVAKARRDIEKHRSEQRVQLLADELSDEEVLSEIEEIRKWARSRRQINQQSLTGSRALTQAGTS